MIIAIAAAAENNALGKDNTLLWHLPNDFKRFKTVTSGHYIIMGRKTFESLDKPLPNRTHIVVTRQNNYAPAGCIVVNSMEEAIAKCPKDQNNYIIGGGEIYKLGLPFTDQIDLTRVHASFDADAYFPDIDMEVWKLITSDLQEKDDRHKYAYSFQNYIRQK